MPPEAQAGSTLSSEGPSSQSDLETLSPGQSQEELLCVMPGVGLGIRIDQGAFLVSRLTGVQVREAWPHTSLLSLEHKTVQKSTGQVNGVSDTVSVERVKCPGVHTWEAGWELAVGSACVQ